jgi:hypothetical protein
MITNTCLTGGSFEVEPPDEDPGDPLLPLGELGDVVFFVDLGDEVLELDFEEPAGVGVGVDSDSVGGGSLTGDEEASGVEVEARGAAGGRISVRDGRVDAARVSSTREPAAPPRITPKPRNTSTSSADTLGGGSVRPDRPAADPAVSVVCPGGRRNGEDLAGRTLRMRRKSRTSWGLREEMRAPQPRQ